MGTGGAGGHSPRHWDAGKRRLVPLIKAAGIGSSDSERQRISVRQGRDTWVRELITDNHASQELTKNPLVLVIVYETFIL
jgi:hypothetical protein